MANRDQVTQSCDRGYNEARVLFDHNDLDAAILKAEDLLDDNDLPLHHRIKLHMATTAAADWYDTDDDLERAKRYG